MLGMAFRKFAQTVVEKIGTVRTCDLDGASGACLGRCGGAATRERCQLFCRSRGGDFRAQRDHDGAFIFYIAKTLATGSKQQISMCLECGLQNGTLAIAIGVMLFGGGAYLIPAATYSLIMFATSLVFLAFARTKLAG